MPTTAPRTDADLFPVYTGPERTADAVIHTLGVILALTGAGLLLGFTIAHGDAVAIAAAVIYAAALVAVQSASAAYTHARRPRLKERLRRLDHAAIYLLIAGTYTPFAAVAIGGWPGIGLLAAVWTVAAVGAALKLFWMRRFERASIALYLALGWIGLPALGTLIASLSTATLILLGIGGLLYTAGVGIHLWERLPFQNALWHALVLAAAGCHYTAVVLVLV